MTYALSSARPPGTMGVLQTLVVGMCMSPVAGMHNVSKAASLVMIVPRLWCAFRRYENALAKANYASLALQAGGEDATRTEEDDEELEATLARARRAALAKAQAAAKSGGGGVGGVDALAARAAARREADERESTAEGAHP